MLTQGQRDERASDEGALIRLFFSFLVSLCVRLYRLFVCLFFCLLVVLDLKNSSLNPTPKALFILLKVLLGLFVGEVVECRGK